MSQDTDPSSTDAPVVATPGRSPVGVAPPSLGRAVVLAVVGAAVAAAVVHLLFDAAGADFVVAPGDGEPSTVSAGLAAGIAAVVTALGGALAAVLARTTGRPSRWFLLAAAAVVALTAINPVLAADQALTVVALEVEHLAVAAVALLLLLPPLRARDRA